MPKENFNLSALPQEAQPTAVKDLLFEAITGADSALEKPEDINIFFAEFCYSLVKKGLCNNLEEAIVVTKKEIPKALKIIGSQKMNAKYVTIWEETLHLGDKGGK